VPAGYFETLADVITARVPATENENDGSPIIDVAGKMMPLDIPAGYFDSLSESILAKIKTQEEQTAAEELYEISPFLAGLTKANAYAVPDGYFEGVSDKQLVLVTENKQAKVVSLFGQRSLMKYAAAASVLVMLAFGINFFFTKSNSQLDSYVKLGLKNYSTEQQLTNGITNIKEADLVTYLQMTADSKDAETIASLVDQTQLPDESDYLDGEFLESFMKELEQTEIKTN
ncbi:MAG: hypothetical protein ACKVOM_04830, partial [Ferruginibacter sp.]